MIRVSEVKMPLDGTKELLEKKLLKILQISRKELVSYRIFKRSLDARKKENIHYVYVVDVEVKQEQKKKWNNKQIGIAPDLSYTLPTGGTLPEQRPVVVGLGPAGLFAGLLLAEMGFQPIVLERGGDVDSRKEAVEHFWKTGQLDAENNVQFGEGGAGTFSDGKLTTRIKDPRCRKVLEELVAAGAPEEILYDAKPHIGTDLLRGIVKTIREKIRAFGGEVHFGAKVTGFLWEGKQVAGVCLQDGRTFQTKDVVLAPGHSARDTFTLLHQEAFALEQKPFAMGVRIEHPQEMVNLVQYGAAAEQLPAADYRLTYTTQQGRGVYTFCMCPGGYVVAAASEEGRLAVNGMSEYARDGKNANSALLVQIFPEDFGSDHPLAGMYFQRQLEEKAFVAGGGTYTAPVQRVGSFLQKKEETVATDEVQATYRPAVRECDLCEIFPPFMIEALREALPAMGKKLKGFDRADALLTAVESRSSSPIRILRDAQGVSLHYTGVYPAGEGAGYAGGIVSAAVDGIYIVEKIAEKYGKCKKNEAVH